MCALFGSARDASLFRKLNQELLHRYIDTEILFYKLNVNSTQTNIYDEADSKIYESATLLYSLITLDDQAWSSEDFGSDVNQTATFAFLRDDLVTANLVVSVGDVIEFKSRFFEIDGIVENQAIAGKDPDSWFGGDSHGYNVSIICQAHVTRQSKLNVIKTRFGNSINTTNSTLPKNL